jgi:1,4-alpha-glucan branching enzyme
MRAITRNKEKSGIPIKPLPASGSLLSDFDTDLIKAGKHYMLYKHLGAHLVDTEAGAGVLFSVWAPNAQKVSVFGDFNGWDKEQYQLLQRWDGTGIWELFIPGIASGLLYKFYITDSSGHGTDKADPFGFEMECPPATASRISASGSFNWSDSEWMETRRYKKVDEMPVSIYEIHLGSWRRVPEEDNRHLRYTELADWLPEYLVSLGFTHVEFMPVMEHPFYGSWGYQITGYFAPSSRYGTPDELRLLIDRLHEHNIGVIFDWVPSHFPGDTHGLYNFDGTHLYEHADLKEGFHPDWKSYIFNFGRNEVRCFLISNAIYWLEEFHVDGLRVDAVASMLYRDYSRKEGEWVPNQFGGRENLEAIAFLRDLNDAVHSLVPGTFMIAEESTAFPGVTKPTGEGGLGFDFKWMMGWMNDTLQYFKRDPLYRNYHQHELVFSMHYFYSERFLLPLSHDEVVHGKGSLWAKMPGDDWQKAANLRLLLGYMMGHPGGKLLFMGAEMAQSMEWRHDFSLDWHLLAHPFHSGIQALIADLNRIYTAESALYRKSYSTDGFEWIDYSDTTNSVIAWIRKGSTTENYLVFIFNAAPAIHTGYRIGVPAAHAFRELLNTDDRRYGGSHTQNNMPLQSEAIPLHGRPYSVSLTLPPLALLILQPQLQAK